jgi:hypothetical protein
MKTNLKYGILGGVILAINAIVFYSLNVDNKLLFSLWIIIQLIVIAFSIYLGVKEKKRIKYQNSISYRDAIFTALIINFLAAIISSASIFFFINSNQNVLNKLYQSNIEQATIQMKELEFKEAEIENRIKLIQKDSIAIYPAWNNFKGILFLGLAISLIVTAILRSEVTKIPEIKRS